MGTTASPAVCVCEEQKAATSKMSSTCADKERPQVAGFGQPVVVVAIDDCPLDAAAVMALAAHGIFGADGQDIHGLRRTDFRQRAVATLGFHRLTQPAGKLGRRHMSAPLDKDRVRRVAALLVEGGGVGGDGRCGASGGVVIGQASAPTMASESFGPKTMSSVP